ncbi:casein kinase 2 regulatory subunit [Coelomomyces lativittatus]|nr:casein kinase 2 regulatory subunit [Coelomomyces lativittatus]
MNQNSNAQKSSSNSNLSLNSTQQRSTTNLNYESASNSSCEYDFNSEFDASSTSENSSASSSNSDSDYDLQSDVEDSSGSVEFNWIQWFLSKPENKYLLPVPEDFIEDEFNLSGLNNMVNHCREAIKMILDYDEEYVPSKEKQVAASAETLYLLIHARYIITKHGLIALFNKVCSRHYGMCPRHFCNRYPLVPIAETDKPKVKGVRLYCNNCQDIYYSPSRRSSRLDGTYF